VVTRGQILDAAGNVLAELEPTNNDISFVGLFHEPGMPLVIRGKDNTDRYVDDPADTVALAGGAVTTVTANFLAAPTAITSATISEIRALGLGGDDSIVAAANVAVPLIVRGGPGDDTVTGGSAADDLAGDAGNDALGGRLGNDSIDGGGGTDTADFGVEMHGVIANLATGRAKGQGRDTLRNLENMIGSPGRDRLTGSAADNILLGGPGADFIVGGAGRDALDGGDGDDSLFGEAGDDVLHGDAGNDLVCGSDGRDVITGGDGDDHLEGGNDDDEIRGGAGADFICGGAGNDLLFGNAGNDSMLGESGIDRLLGGSDFDSILFDASDLPVDLGGAGRDGGKAFRFGE
jgi:Ca2+-binding RTX toxin-like protein